MDEEEIKDALQKESLCRIAFIEDQYPYISPFQYIYINGEIYFHFTDYGKKKRILKKNKNVCVSIENFAKDLSNYFFISMQGQLNLIVDEKDKNEIMKSMIEQAKQKFSEEFLSAHGFSKKRGWGAVELSNQLIYKFDRIGDIIALKSI